MDTPGAGHSVTNMAEFDSPQADRSTRLAIIADPHVCVDEEGYDKIFKSTTVFERTIADINRRDVDYTISVGDLTLEGRAEEYDIVDAALRDLDTPFASIPGNHDVRKSFDSHAGISIDDFADRYAPGGLPFVVETGGVDIVGLDSSSAEAVSDSHDGYVDDSQVAWLDGVLDDTDDAIVLVHHNLPGALEQFDEYREAVDPSLGTPPVLREPGPLVDVLSAHAVPLVLSGHLHIPAFATTDAVREVLAPSTCTFPQSYLLVEIDRSGTTVEYVPVTTVDEATTAYTRRSRLKPKAKALTAMASVRLSTFPLYQESTSTYHQSE